ncbi:MAG: ATP-binding protein [Candidatus Hydrogenedentes bacterium]|nr:ATP-binding protein [Candidatus Hydrogenedentota bacterium]
MKDRKLYTRFVAQRVAAALADTPIVVLQGARQTGKSTLARMLASRRNNASYLTLDDVQTLAAAKSDPQGFVQGLSGTVIIDEIQRAPELLLCIKADVDRDRTPGRFLLTGSSHVLNVPQLADAFVGRMELVTLWPLSQCELTRRKVDFIRALFSDEPLKPTRRIAASPPIVEMIVIGGFPEAVARSDRGRRGAWFDAYISTIIQREVRELANIAGLSELPRLLSVLAARAGGLVNYADLARDAGLNQVTLKRYSTLLNAVFLTHPVQPWFTNRIKRVMKSEKLYFVDTGILAHLQAIDETDLKRDTRAKGALFENFVLGELLKQLGWSNVRAQIHHFRSYSGEEVDFVLETPGQRKIVGIEIKASATVQASDFDGLKSLRAIIGNTFHRGVVLYAGDTLVPFAPDLFAVPIHYLWTAVAA